MPPLPPRKSLNTNSMYEVIFEGHKFSGFHCKLAEWKILTLEKKWCLKETTCSTRENLFRLTLCEIRFAKLLHIQWSYYVFRI